MKALEHQVALVTGASGVGKGVALAVAALASDPAALRWTGQVVVAAALAEEYGFKDVDGRQPRPLTLQEA